MAIGILTLGFGIPTLGAESESLELRARAETLENRARTLREEEPERARALMREARELRARSEGERPAPEQTIDRKREEVRELMAELKDLRAAGKEDRALEVKRRIQTLEGELEAADRPRDRERSAVDTGMRERGPNQRAGMGMEVGPGMGAGGGPMWRQNQDGPMRGPGQMWQRGPGRGQGPMLQGQNGPLRGGFRPGWQGPDQQMRQAWKQQQKQMRRSPAWQPPNRPMQGPPGTFAPPAPENQERVRQAIQTLRTLGMHEEAERLTRRARELRSQLNRPGMAQQRPGVGPLPEVRPELEGLRGEVRELRELVRDLSRRLEEQRR